VIYGGSFYGPAVSIPLFFGRLIVKPKRSSLFSERYGCVPTIAIGPVRITWRARNAA
jgi:hypothetical protein